MEVEGWGGSGHTAKLDVQMLMVGSLASKTESCSFEVKFCRDFSDRL